MSLEKCSEIPKIHGNHTKDRSVKEEYICKEELTLEWQEEDELCAQVGSNFLVEEPVDVEALNNFTNATCDSIGKNDIKNNETCGKMKDLSNKQKRRPKNALYNAVVVIERLPEQVLKGCLLNKENISTKVKSTGHTKISFSKLYDIFCEHCKKVVRPDSKYKFCSKCKRAVIFKCKNCSKQFKSDTGIYYHLKTTCQSQGKYYQCAGCIYKSVFKDSVTKHMQILHQNLSISDMKIIASQDLQKDLENSELYLHKCLKCGKQFKHVQNLIRHLKACGNLKCQVALIGKDDVENETPTSSNSEAHFLQQDLSSDKLTLVKWAKHFCKKCNKRTALNFHNSTKCKECRSILLFECSKCKKHYDSTRSIIRHLRSICAIGEVYFCSKCNYQSSVKAFLGAHYKRVHESTSVECPKCKNVLKSKYTLHKHLQCCGKEPYLKSVTCPKCGKKLKNKFILSDHISICGIEPRLQCPLCIYKAHSNYHIRRHMALRHFKDTNKYPDCPKCGVKMESKTCQRTHLRFCGTSKLHFRCDHCPFMFGRKYALQIHIIRRHLENIDKSEESDVDVVQ